MAGSIVNLAKLNVTENRAIAINAITDNIFGIQNIMAANSLVPGWNKTTDTSPQPTRVMFKCTDIIPTEWVALVGITYNADGSPTVIEYEYSNDSTNGTNNNWYDLNDSGTLNLQTFTYDGNGDLDYTTWS